MPETMSSPRATHDRVPIIGVVETDLCSNDSDRENNLTAPLRIAANDDGHHGKQVSMLSTHTGSNLAKITGNQNNPQGDLLNGIQARVDQAAALRDETGKQELPDKRSGNVGETAEEDDAGGLLGPFVSQLSMNDLHLTFSDVEGQYLYEQLNTQKGVDEDTLRLVGQFIDVLNLERLQSSALTVDHTGTGPPTSSSSTDGVTGIKTSLVLKDMEYASPSGIAPSIECSPHRHNSETQLVGRDEGMTPSQVEHDQQVERGAIRNYTNDVVETEDPGLKQDHRIDDVAQYGDGSKPNQVDDGVESSAKDSTTAQMSRLLECLAATNHKGNGMSSIQKKIYDQMVDLARNKADDSICEADSSPGDLTVKEKHVENLHSAGKSESNTNTQSSQFDFLRKRVNNDGNPNILEPGGSLSIINSKNRLYDPPSANDEANESNSTAPRQDPPTNSSSREVKETKPRMNDTEARDLLLYEYLSANESQANRTDPDLLIYEYLSANESQANRTDPLALPIWPVAGSSSVEMEAMAETSVSTRSALEADGDSSALGELSVSVHSNSVAATNKSMLHGSMNVMLGDSVTGNRRNSKPTMLKFPPTPEARLFQRKELRNKQHSGQTPRNAQPTFEEKKEEAAWPPKHRILHFPTQTQPGERYHLHDQDSLLTSEAFNQIVHKLASEGEELDKRQLAQVIRFSCPFLYGGQHTTDELAGLRAEVIDMGLSQGTADRLLEMFEAAFPSKSDIEQAPSDEFISKKHQKALDGKGDLMERFLNLIIAANSIRQDSAHAPTCKLTSSKMSREAGEDNGIFDQEIQRSRGIGVGDDSVDKEDQRIKGTDIEESESAVEEDDAVSFTSNDGTWWEVPSKLGSRSVEEEYPESDELHEDVHVRSRGEELSGIDSDEFLRRKDLDHNQKQPQEDGDINKALVGIAARALAQEEREEGKQNDEPKNVDQEIAKFWKEQEKQRQTANIWAARRSSRQKHKPFSQRHQGALSPRDEKPDVFDLGRVGTSSFASRTVAPRPASLNHENMEAMWVSKRKMTTYGQTSENWLSQKKNKKEAKRAEPPQIDGVRATSTLSVYARAWRSREYHDLGARWRMPYKQRTNRHPGYVGVDLNSLHELSTLYAEKHHNDAHPWEHREVKQRFLDEVSVAHCRNWFGKLRRFHANPIVETPVCRPKSMEMPMRAPDWTDEWFRTPTLVPLGSNLSSSYDDADHLPKLEPDRKSPRGNDVSDSDSWEDTPECGTLKNVRLKPGDRISRLTPELTSSVRRSRWRKKHFPRGLPY